MKKIEQLLKAWREKQNINHIQSTIKDDLISELNEVILAQQKLDWNNYAEELADIAILSLNAIGLLNMSYKSKPYSVEGTLEQIESYINNIRLEIPFQTYGILCTLVNICEELVNKKKYDFKRVVNEKILVLQSRIQCPEQKKHWELHGASGKWEKSKRKEDKDLVYVPNFGKCKS